MPRHRQSQTFMRAKVKKILCKAIYCYCGANLSNPLIALMARGLTINKLVIRPWS